MIAPHKTETCQNDDVVLSGRHFGQPGKIPLLFVHGLSYFSYDWVDIGSRLAQDREAVAMDMRGFGDSSQSLSNDYTLPTMAGDLGTMLDHLGWSQAIIFGHSMGGRTSAVFAARNPERVAGLVLVDYSPTNSPTGAKRVANTVANVPDVFKTIEDAMVYFGDDINSPQAPDRRARYAAYLRPTQGGYTIKRDNHFRDQFRRQLETGEKPALGVDMWQILEQLSVPTLVIRGTRSDMFAPGVVPMVKAANPRIKIVEVDSGHNVAQENPDAFYAAAHSFITSLQGDKS
ncbi:alpha/beta fold hydrolase [Eoetvoesiella caeni]